MRGRGTGDPVIRLVTCSACGGQKELGQAMHSRAARAEIDMLRRSCASTWALRDVKPGFWFLLGVALRGVKPGFWFSASRCHGVKPGFWFALGVKRRITCGVPGTPVLPELRRYSPGVVVSSI